MDRLTVLRQARWCSSWTHGVFVGAECHPPRQAIFAVAAEDRQGRDHMIARLDIGHLVADRFDDAGRLVTHHRRYGGVVVAGQIVAIAVTHAGGDRANQDFPRSWIVDLYILDGEFTGDGSKYCCFHVRPLLTGWADTMPVTGSMLSLLWKAPRLRGHGGSGTELANDLSELASSGRKHGVAEFG